MRPHFNTFRGNAFANPTGLVRRVAAQGSLARDRVETREVAPGLNVDLDAVGDVVGFDIDGASRRLDLTTLEAIALPTKTTKAA